jgi:hypothetical protein
MAGLKLPPANMRRFTTTILGVSGRKGAPESAAPTSTIDTALPLDRSSKLLRPTCAGPGAPRARSLTRSAALTRRLTDNELRPPRREHRDYPQLHDRELVTAADRQGGSLGTEGSQMVAINATARLYDCYDCGGPAPGAFNSRFRVLRNNGCCLHLPRRDPHHAQASFCKCLAMNPNLPDGLLDGTSITSLAQLASHNLSCCRHRQAVDELDSTRILVGGETIAHEG